MEPSYQLHVMIQVINTSHKKLSYH